MAYALGPVKAHVKAAANEIGPKFGVTTIYGFRQGGGEYGISDHPLGLALDFMVYRNKARGDGIANYAFTNQGRLRVHYIIWYRKIYNVKRASEGWRDYHGTSNPHTDHVHISFLKEGDSGGSDQPGGGAGGGSGIPGIPDLSAVTKASEWLTNPNNWKRIGIFLAGAVLLIMALLRMASSELGLGDIIQGAAKMKGKVSGG